MRFLWALAFVVFCSPAVAAAAPKYIPVCTVGSLADNSCLGRPPSLGDRAWVTDAQSASTCAVAGVNKYFHLCVYKFSGASLFWAYDPNVGDGTPDNSSITIYSMAASDFGAFTCTGDGEACAINGIGLSWYHYQASYSADPDTAGASSLLSTGKCFQTMGGAPVTCMATGTNRLSGIYRVANEMPTYVGKLTCVIDAAATIDADDILTVDVVSDTLNGGTPTRVGTGTVVFTGSAEIVANSIKSVDILAVPTGSETAIAIRGLFTDTNADAGAGVVSFGCWISISGQP